MDLSQTEINLENVFKFSVKSDVLGGNFYFDNLDKFDVKGRFNGNLSANNIGNLNVLNLEGIVNVTGQINSIKGNSLIGAINAGIIKKISLREVSDSVIKANYLGSVKIRGIAQNTDIIAGVDSVNEIYGDLDDASVKGIRDSIGSVSIGSYVADSFHGVLGVGSF